MSEELKEDVLIELIFSLDNPFDSYEEIKVELILTNFSQYLYIG